MLWMALLWFYSAYILFGFSWKTYRIYSGQDEFSWPVLLEELASLLFFSFGFIAMYDLAVGQQSFQPLVWRLWLIVALLLAVLPLLVTTPKTAFSKQLVGQKGIYIGMIVAAVLFAPVYVAAWLLAGF
ncbi:hypothetical protein IC617_09700 [Neiella sp. HB171785]|uniref:Uncharacterized protein n=1 Tax=Neiella litorisoli TaxID=2771431 RepID=A0A8J6UJ16_9GAMM|nr:hypothetical protein [Neiella litorisoli]MBD1389703.1 hypothetical protein [Neiella litorisoli]